MLDQMSGGRFELGIGRGISPIELGLYGVDPKQAQDIYEEVLAIVRIGLTSDRAWSARLRRRGRRGAGPERASPREDSATAGRVADVA